MTLGITASAKTRTLVVGVPNFVLSIVASSKTVTRAAGNVSLTESGVTNLVCVAKTVSRSNCVITGGGSSISGSATTISRSNIILTTLSIAYRINKSKMFLMTNSDYVLNRYPLFTS